MLLATRSQGKLRELRPLFAARGIGIIDLDDAGIVESDAEDALEIYATFEENALAKARYFARLSGRPTLADDSGIAVDCLGGRPGVMSKRWSGRADLHGQALDDENNRLLLEAMRDASRDAIDGGAGDRRARYVCAAAFVDGSRSDLPEIVCRGEVHGVVLDAPRGSGGFGYDPYFFAEELGKTFGEASREEKERISHRGRAFRELIERIEQLGRAIVSSA